MNVRALHHVLFVEFVCLSQKGGSSGHAMLPGLRWAAGWPPVKPCHGIGTCSGSDIQGRLQARHALHPTAPSTNGSKPLKAHGKWPAPWDRAYTRLHDDLHDAARHRIRNGRRPFRHVFDWPDPVRIDVAHSSSPASSTSRSERWPAPCALHRWTKRGFCRRSIASTAAGRRYLHFPGPSKGIRPVAAELPTLNSVKPRSGFGCIRSAHIAPATNARKPALPRVCR